MKKIFFIAGIFSAGCIAAQSNEVIDVQKFLKKHKRPVPGSVITHGQPVLSQSFTVLPSGNKLYTLSQDHMPCIVPDMNQFNMPVVTGNTAIPSPSSPGAIPNPAVPAVPPYIITPGKKD